MIRQEEYLQYLQLKEKLSAYLTRREIHDTKYKRREIQRPGNDSMGNTIFRICLIYTIYNIGIDKQYMAGQATGRIGRICPTEYLFSLHYVLLRHRNSFYTCRIRFCLYRRNPKRQGYRRLIKKILHDFIGVFFYARI